MSDTKEVIKIKANVLVTCPYCYKKIQYNGIPWPRYTNIHDISTETITCKGCKEIFTAGEALSLKVEFDKLDLYEKEINNEDR